MNQSLYPSNEKKEQTVEQSLKYIASSLKFDMKTHIKEAMMEALEPFYALLKNHVEGPHGRQ